MGYVLILIGLHQLLTWRQGSALRAGWLGAGLILVGAGLVVAPASPGSTGVRWHDALTWLGLAAMVVGLVHAHREGTLRRTFRCGSRVSRPG